MWPLLPAMAFCLGLVACGNSGVPLADSGIGNPPATPVAPPTTSTEDSPLPAPEAPLTLVSDTPLTARLHELVVMSPAMEREVPLRVLLPTNYDAQSSARYPVLYMMHGCCNGARGYATYIDNHPVEEITADLPIILVMPEGGAGGLYSDWYNNGLGGTPRWETHHIKELLHFIEQRYAVRRDRDGRMLLGISMGGHGSFAYASKYPQLFGSASAMSPVVDTNTLIARGVLDGGSASDSGPPGSVWGPRESEEVRWRGHNSWDLAENLSNTALWIRTGNGYTDGNPAPTDAFEFAVHEAATNMHQQLDRFGIPHSFVDYGQGTHSIPFWDEGLRILIPQQLALAQQRRSTPRRFTYLSIDQVFSVYGWQVSIERSVIEFARLGEVSEAGFTLAGSGQASVRTAAWYVPGKSYRVQVGEAGQMLIADPQGRLEIAVDLGPSRTIQQFRPNSPAGYLRSVAVSITP